MAISITTNITHCIDVNFTRQKLYFPLVPLMSETSRIHNRNICLFSGPKEYCHLETFNASCPHDSVIVIESARYGRMEVGRCVKRNLGYVGCAVNVERYMDSRCSGRQSCRLSIVELAKTDFKPCPDDVTSYLLASYRCQKGERMNNV